MSHKAFAVVLQDLRDGRVHAEFTKLFGELVAQVKETGKGGEISLKLKIKPATRGADVDKITIADVITITQPKPERGEDIYWLTDDGDLSRNHPRQGNLELRDATPTAPAQFKEAK
ncbi:hypothetical protein QN372_00695 [Undibacterium sp. RTI2.1]|uniref:hypothetical protein n=1 Tax=unclassified Undibacterium TaxID=2630295 RepID=UPI002AB57FAA|nr:MULTISPECIES: hypothetical protein [unclassified Undibacterium]MDY7537654.1 hypothetical protein [Undibacterium sp. 5I1]MEB0029256.1 hypothetical protein [Undibacterium sp. RTI2.1]MEB0115564.1 hypothetical protein [Undibacterium sp. RTI2.2]MEB0256391.1 hypothetical protein [Undibacterium sp. 5I1]